MDDNIINLFREKNSKIFIDKLLLDIENNAESLQLTVENKIALAVPKLLKRLSEVFNEYKISYEMQGLNDCLKDHEMNVKIIVDSLLANKKEMLAQSLSGKEAITPQSIDDATDHNTQLFKEKFDLMINNAIYMQLQNNISQRYKLHDDEVKEALARCLNKYDLMLSGSVMQAIYDRDNTLKNITNESYQKYSELNIKTGIVSAQPAVKKKEIA